jgi:hypothetical protein
MKDGMILTEFTNAQIGDSQALASRYQAALHDIDQLAGFYPP